MRLQSLSASIFRKLCSVSMFALSLLLAACDDDKSAQDKTEVQQPSKHVLLTEQNIDAYAHQLAQDYQSSLDKLLNAYNQAKLSGNSYDFVEYRNNKWTPAYMVLKDQHAAVFAENQAFLEHHSAAPLFTLFEYLIYIGLDLKNGLLEEDEGKQQQALTTAETERQQVIAIIQQLDKAH